MHNIVLNKLNGRYSYYAKHWFELSTKYQLNINTIISSVELFHVSLMLGSENVYS